MEQVPMNKEERNFLVGSLIVTGLFELAMMFGLGYFLVYGHFKKEYLWDADKFMIFGYPAVFLILMVIQMPKIVHVLQDLVSGAVLEGVGTTTDHGISGYNVFDKFIRIDVFGKDKIKILRPFKGKDRLVLYPGKRNKFRIATQSKILLEFSAVVI